MNKSTNVPPGPSLKGGKNRTRRGGGFFNCIGSRCSRKATVAPKPINSRTPEMKRMDDEIQDLINLIKEKTDEIEELPENSKENNINSRWADIRVLQERYNKLLDIYHEKFTIPKLKNIAKTSNMLARPFKGGKRKSGRTRRSRK